MPTDLPLDPDMIQAADEMAAVFRQANVLYALIGGVAVSIRSNPRSTRDLDFILSVPQMRLPSLLQSLRDHGFEFDDMQVIREWTQEGMTVLSYRGIRVDWLKPVLAAYQHILERATDEGWKDQFIRVATTEGLILLKLLAFRPQDQADIVNLIAAHEGPLNIDWIRSEWDAILDADHPRMRWFLGHCKKADLNQ